MIIVLRRSNLFILSVAFLLSCLTVNMARNAHILPASAVPVSDKVIVLDAGHGASDGGAIGKSGTVEKELNLKITLKLQELLEKTGATVIVTRSDDSPIASTKKDDMRQRRLTKETSEADVFVSVHMNKFPQEKYSGAQVFYADDEESKRLGEQIQSAMVEILNPKNNRLAKKTDGNIYLLKNSKTPSVIVECGFLSNPQEEMLLSQSNYQDRVAWSVYSGILKYFDMKH